MRVYVFLMLIGDTENETDALVIKCKKGGGSLIPTGLFLYEFLTLTECCLE